MQTIAELINAFDLDYYDKLDTAKKLAINKSYDQENFTNVFVFRDKSILELEVENS